MDQEYNVKIMDGKGKVSSWVVKADTAVEARRIMMEEHKGCSVVSCRKGKKTDYFRMLAALPM